MPTKTLDCFRYETLLPKATSPQMQGRSPRSVIEQPVQEGRQLEGLLLQTGKRRRLWR